MRYHYLKARGALNETGTQPAGAAWGGARADMPRLRSIPPEVFGLLPASVAYENLVIPVAVDGETVTLAAVNPDDIALADKLTFLMARKVKLVAATRDEIAALIERCYGPAREEM